MLIEICIILIFFYINKKELILFYDINKVAYIQMKIIVKSQTNKVIKLNIQNKYIYQTIHIAKTINSEDNYKFLSEGLQLIMLQRMLCYKQIIIMFVFVAICIHNYTDQQLICRDSWFKTQLKILNSPQSDKLAKSEKL
ncbi:hypothetical protein pb186bvf_009733 [Paramecium bursaria]